MDKILEVRKLTWKKGYDALYLGEFFKADGSSCHSMRIYNKATNENYNLKN